ncbi:MULTISPECIES: winged helix-turn-helix domain-containing protein [Haloferax]|uniref:winged helix-turn-helix domain-containing protein n=1 Tax=Haloferax TaxID=2251 RepID=UPI000B7C7949|nr:MULTISPECIES: winged helix-turn-helix domain-containing protein [Haloferax]MDS0242869.1 winged helix-turn-helix domain-containing protein [Haloferax sp. S2CR25]MDS0445990.1 winged helix-turn-helix domain-containing protein [Haloferax sp. S2CR25-2]
MLWWLIGGSRGGRNRLRIIRALDDMPMNANQLSNELDLDYKTTQHHLELLVENNVLMTMGDNYGKTYFLTDRMEANLDVLDEVARKANLTDVSAGGDDA